MPFYFYDIYNTEKKYKFTKGSKVTISSSDLWKRWGSSYYTVNTKNGTWDVGGPQVVASQGAKQLIYWKNGSKLTTLDATGGYSNAFAYEETITVTVESEIKTDLRQTNAVFNDTYPIDGLRSGYWYIRKGQLLTPPIPTILIGEEQTTTKIKPDQNKIKIVWLPVIEPNGLAPQYIFQYKNPANNNWTNYSTYNSGYTTERDLTISTALLQILNTQPLEIRLGFSNGYETSYSDSVLIVMEKDKQAIQIDNKFYMVNNELQWQEVLSLDETDDTLITKIARQNKESKMSIILKERRDNMAVFSQKINLKKHKDLIKIKVTPVTQPSTP